MNNDQRVKLLELYQAACIACSAVDRGVGSVRSFLDADATFREALDDPPATLDKRIGSC